MAINNENRCKTVFITDAPASSDYFSGAHESIANAIKNLIMSKDEEGCKTIGLEGEWGSGKSTILNLLRDFWKPPDNIQVFIFDAWAHEGDPLRRIILEKLMRNLKSRGWLSEEKYEEIIHRLQGKSKEEKITITPKLSNLGAVFVGFIVFSPLILALINAGLRDGVSFSIFSGLPWNWQFTVGIVFYLIVVALGFYFAKKEGKDSLATILRQKDTETTTHTVENIDPTSVDFSNEFKLILEEALCDSENPDRKLIIVFDNLDRVSQNDAFKIFSTIQTFLSYGEKFRQRFKNKLWTIIPYGLEGISQLWSNDKVYSRESDNFAKAFLDKQFQIRFYVPPILLSDWHGYLKILLHNAFPDHNEEMDFHNVYKVYLNGVVNDWVKPTPRDLKLFVNQIGGIHQQWGDTFPLEHIAYFVILKRRGEDIKKGLENGEIPESEFQDNNGNGLRENLAAMFFNVEKEIAIQLLIKDQLENALRNRRGSELRNLAEVEFGFWETLDSLPFINWEKENQKDFTNAVWCLVESDVITLAEKSVHKSIINEFQRIAFRVDRWVPFDKELAEGLVAIIQLKPNERIASRIFESIHDPGSGSDFPEYLREWIGGLLLFVRETEKFDVPNLHINNKPLKDIDAYVYACSFIYEEDPNGIYWDLIRPDFRVERIPTIIETYTNEGKIQAGHIGAFRIIKERNVGLNWKTTLSAINGRLSKDVEYSTDEISGMIGILWELKSETSTADGNLNSLAHQGIMLHHLYSAREGNDEFAMAWCVFAFLQYVPNHSISNQIGRSSQGLHFLDEIFRKPNEHEGFNTQFLNITEYYCESNLFIRVYKENTKAGTWIKHLYSEAIDKLELDKFVRIEDLLNDWKVISEILDEQHFNKFVGDLVLKTDIKEQIKSDGFNIENVELYTSIVKSESDDLEDFFDFCSKGLNELDQNSWIANFDNETRLVELILENINKNDKFILDSPIYQDALVDNGKKIIDSSFSPSKYKNEWNSLPKALKKNSRKKFRSDLIYYAKQKDGDINETFFEIFGDEIIDEDLLVKDNRIVSDLFIPLLKKRNIKGLGWIGKVLDQFPRFIRVYKDKIAVDDFKNRIKLLISSDIPDTEEESIWKIAELLNVK